jgi:hypothetical protein
VSLVYCLLREYFFSIVDKLFKMSYQYFFLKWVMFFFCIKKVEIIRWSLVLECSKLKARHFWSLGYSLGSISSCMDTDYYASAQM